MGRIPSRHRLGVFTDPLAERESDRYLYDNPIDNARWHFLDALARMRRMVLEDLRRIGRVGNPAEDDVALRAWAEIWCLTDEWCMAYAREVIEFYRNHDTDPHTLVWLPTDTAEDVPADRIPKPLKVKPDLFEQLAEYHLSPRLTPIASRHHLTRAAVEKNVKRLAKQLGLTTLRPAPLGNPRIAEIGASVARRAATRRKASRKRR